MFCKKCGAKIDDDALFCFKCGEKTKTATAEKEPNVNKNITTGKQQEQKGSKALNIFVILLLVIIALISAAIPIINHYNNSVINSELGSLWNTNTYFIQRIVLNDSSQAMVQFSDSLNWDVLEGKKIKTGIYIMESGAIVDMDKQGVYSLAKGYSTSYPGVEYSTGSKQERVIEYGDDGYYNLCIGSSNSDTIEQEYIYDFDYYGEKVKFDENRIYNFSIELYSLNGNGLFHYDNYFRYTNGKFIQVKTTDLKPEDTYFAWKDNELHFAHFSEYSNDVPPVPCFNVSDETYDSRD